MIEKASIQPEMISENYYIVHISIINALIGGEKIIRDLLVKFNELGYMVTVENTVYVIMNKKTKKIVAEIHSNNHFERLKKLQKIYEELKNKKECEENH